MTTKKIKTNSWHYELVRASFNKGPSRSLCIYFWQVVWSVLAVIFGAIFVGVILIGFVTGLFIGFIDHGIGPTFVSSFLWCFVGVGLLGIVKEYAKEQPEKFICKTIFEFKKVDKEPSLLREYIKAKKEKVCPRLEFINE